MSGKAEARTERALSLAGALATEGRAMDAEVVRSVCRQNSAYRETCRRLHDDNSVLIEELAATSHSLERLTLVSRHLASAIEAQRAGTTQIGPVEDESAVPKGDAR